VTESAQQQVIYWTRLDLPSHHWSLHLAATSTGLCLLTLPHENVEHLRQWAHNHVPKAELIEDSQAMANYTSPILAYLKGSRAAFSLALDLIGTPFQRSVWQALTAIPYGETRSYADIAKAIGRPTAVRAVGAANGRNPVPIVVPCHRVIGQNGTLTGYRGGLAVKERLLRLEGFTAYTAQGHARFAF